MLEIQVKVNFLTQILIASQLIEIMLCFYELRPDFYIVIAEASLRGRDDCVIFEVNAARAV